MVYMTTPAIPSCFVAFFSDPYSHFEIFNFYCTSYLRMTGQMSDFVMVDLTYLSA